MGQPGSAYEPDRPRSSGSRGSNRSTKMRCVDSTINGCPSAVGSETPIVMTPLAGSAIDSIPGTGTSPPAPSVLTVTVPSEPVALRTTSTLSMARSVPIAMLQRPDANTGGAPITTVVATVSPVWRVMARSTRIEPGVSVENTAPCRPCGTPTSSAINETTLPAGTVSGSGLTKPLAGSTPRNATLTTASVSLAL